MHRRVWLCSLLVLAVPDAVWSQAPQAASAFQVVVLEGTAEEVGKQYAEKLGDEVQLLHAQYLRKWFDSDLKYRQAVGAATLFQLVSLREHVAEMDALAAGTGFKLGDVLLANSFLDLSPMTGCSTVTLAAEASPDGVARFGRNLDFHAMDVADRHSVLLVVKPKGRYAFAAVSWPGLIGVLSGMNEHGLTLANMEVDREPRLPQAMPYTLLYRATLERCRTVDEAVAFLKKTPRQTANNLMLMDAAGARAVVELTPEKIVVRRAKGTAPLVSTNHHRGTNPSKPGLCPRYDRLRTDAQQQFGRLDAAGVQKLLAPVGQGKMTLQSMVFEPSNRVLYLAVGSAATGRTYERVDLQPHFAK